MGGGKRLKALVNDAFARFFMKKMLRIYNERTVG